MSDAGAAGPSPRSLARGQRWLLVAAALAYAVWAALYIWRTSFVVDGERVFCLWDDGMISMQYARNLARGHGLVWNAGEPGVQGFSNLGVTLFMAALHAVVPPRAVALAFQIANLVGLLGVVALVFSLSRRVFPARPQIAVGASAATMACAPLSLWSLQGADSGFMALWILATLWAMSGQSRAGGRWPGWIYGLLAVGLVLRVDGVVAFVPLCAVAVVDGGPRRRLWICTLVLVGVSAALLTWSRVVYGAWLPNTVMLKATGSPRGAVLATGLSQLAGWGPWLLPAIVLAVYATVRERARPVVVGAAAVGAAALASAVWVGGDWAPEFGNRLFAPCLPVVIILVAAGAAPLCERALVDWSPPARTWAAVAVTVGVGWLGNPPRATADFFAIEGPTMFRPYNRRNALVARYLARHTDPEVTVAVHWAGVPIYFSERRGLDVLGKSDRHIAQLSVPRFFPGHSKWDWDYVLDEVRPEIIVRATRGLQAHPRYRRDYVLVMRSGRPQLAIRRDRLGALHDPQATLASVDGDPLPRPGTPP